MPSVLVGIVGFNPASVLVAARALSPTRVVLICTADSKAIAETIASHIGEPTRSTLVTWNRHTALDEVAAQIASDVDPNPEEIVWLDVTGGTKVLSIGAWQGLSLALGPRLQGVYLEAGGHLIDARTGAIRPVSVKIEPAEFLEWNGLNAKSAAWSGPLAAVPQSVVHRETLGRALFKAYGARPASARPRQIAGEPWIHLTGSALPTQLPPGFSFDAQRKRLFDHTRTGYLSAAGWLEELCLCASARIAAGSPDVVAAFNLTIGGANDLNDEVDIVLTRGARVVVIEAKARHHSTGAGEDLQKRVQKVAAAFGALARVVFVHPAWGPHPPRALVGLAGRGTTLVGSSLPQLDEAIRTSLGL